MSTERILYLLKAKSEKIATGAELLELDKWLVTQDDKGAFEGFVLQQLEEYPVAQKERKVDWESIYAAVLLNRDRGELPPDKVGQMISMQQARVSRLKWVKYAAAVLLLAIASGLIIDYLNLPAKQPAIAYEPHHDIIPGSNKAILTLADGTNIVLDSAANGQLAQEGNANIVKLSNGEIAYKVAAGAPLPPLLNTMSTPRGGQYQLTLPDGTRVWLNAASSITYPTAFVGKQRKVTVKGEAYFEIKPDKQLPFFVTARETDVQVLGTSFNVTAYADEENVYTTLLEGSVRVNVDRATRSKESSVLLKPGEQAQINNGLRGEPGEILVVKNANLAKVMAWKNGAFDFENANLEDVMRQLARWYDLDIVYEGRVPDIHFGGKLSRNIKLSGILKALKESKVHYRLEGRRLIILP